MGTSIKSTFDCLVAATFSSVASHIPRPVLFPKGLAVNGHLSFNERYSPLSLVIQLVVSFFVFLKLTDIKPGNAFLTLKVGV